MAARCFILGVVGIGPCDEHGWHMAAHHLLFMNEPSWRMAARSVFPCYWSAYGLVMRMVGIWPLAYATSNAGIWPLVPFSARIGRHMAVL